MTRTYINNVRLGTFILAGLVFLVLLLYMIGKNRHLFGSNYLLKARFENVQGLKAGHNVRYAGIECGTVKKVSFLNDTLIEVDMLIENKMKSVIRENAIVSVGTEGFVGNKVVNIVPGHGTAPFASDKDMLNSKRPPDTDEMIRTLSKTNDDIAIVADNLKTTIRNINNSEALWELLNEKSIPRNIKFSAENIQLASERAAQMIDDLHLLVENIKNGKGSLGALLTDSSFAINLNDAVDKVSTVAIHVDTLSQQLNQFVSLVRSDVNNGKGVANALLKDSAITTKLNQSLDHIEKGTEAFSQDMEALKHNFLLRGYFRKLEKRAQKDEKKNTANLP